MRYRQTALLMLILCVLGFAAVFYQDGYLNILIFVVLINGIMAVSYDIAGRFLGLISLGHATFFGLGAYFFGIGITKGLAFGPAFILAGILSLGSAALIAIILARLNHGYFSLATLGILFVFERLAESLEGLSGGPAGLYIPESMPRHYYGYLAFGLLLLTVWGYRLYAGSRWGLFSKETAADEDAALAIGIPTHRVKTAALIAAALPASLAGALYLARTSHISPDSGFSLSLSITALLASRIVPLEGALGPLAGALVITAAEEVIWTKFAGFNQALFGLILLVAALCQGLHKSKIPDSSF